MSFEIFSNMFSYSVQFLSLLLIKLIEVNLNLDFFLLKDQSLSLFCYHFWSINKQFIGKRFLNDKITEQLLLKNICRSKCSKVTYDFEVSIKVTRWSLSQFAIPKFPRLHHLRRSKAFSTAVISLLLSNKEPVR